MIDVRCKKCNKLLFKIQQEPITPNSLAEILPVQFVQIKCGRCKDMVVVPFRGHINASNY